jgi:outer membrane protein
MWISSRSSRARSSAISRPQRRSVGLALVLISSLTFLAGPSRAAEDGRVVPVVADPGVTAQQLELPPAERLELSLDQALLYTLQHNVAIVVQRYDHRASLLAVDAERGYFDLNLSGTAGLNSTSRATSSTLEEADVLTEEGAFINASATRNLPWGGFVDVGFNNNRGESSNRNVVPNPSFSLGLNFLYEQPLLRNFGKEVTERPILIAASNAQIDREVFRDLIEDLILDVSNSYWDLVGAREQLAVSEESLQLARELHEMNRIQVDVGTKAPLELVQSEVGVAIREEEIVRQRSRVEDFEDLLRSYMNLAQNELWNMPILPVTAAEIEHQPVDLAAAVATARSRRTDIVRQQLLNEQRALDLRYANNQLKPRLDLRATYGLSGLAGDSVEIDPETGEPIRINQGYGDALSQLTGLDYDRWGLQLTFGLPLQNTTARALKAQAEVRVDQGNMRLRDLQDIALLEVRRAARQVETAAKSIELAKVSSSLARKNLEAEQKRYENGLSTSFQVLEIQEDLSIALSSEVNAVITYRKAVVNLDRATGELLEKTGVSLAGDEDSED